METENEHYDDLEDLQIEFHKETKDAAKNYDEGVELFSHLQDLIESTLINSFDLDKDDFILCTLIAELDKRIEENADLALKFYKCRKKEILVCVSIYKKLHTMEKDVLEDLFYYLKDELEEIESEKLPNDPTYSEEFIAKIRNQYKRVERVLRKRS